MMKKNIEEQAKAISRDLVQDPDSKPSIEASRTSGSPPIKVSFEKKSRVSKIGDDFVSELVINGGDLVSEGKIEPLGKKERGLDDSDINGVPTLMKLQDSVKEVGTDDVVKIVNSDGVSLVVDLRGEAEKGAIEKIRDFGEIEKIRDFDEVENGEEEDASENKEDDENDFRVGDFVWGKIKHHLWWPGQIYDPSAASDYALKIKQRGSRILVTYFGDGTFSWCTPSQLKPFEDKFDEMVMQSVSKSFVNGVKKAVDEFRRLAEVQMICSCLPKEALDEVRQPTANNTGIEDGVYVPEGRIGDRLTAVFEPCMYLADVKSIAATISSGNLLDISVIRSRLSAYYRWKGIKFYEPRSILGLEGKWENLGQFPGPSQDDDDFLTPNPETKQKSETFSGFQQRRKKRSLADILNAETENIMEKDNTPKQVKTGKKSATKKTKDRNDESDDDDDDFCLKSLLRKLKETKLSAESPPVTTRSKVSPSVENGESGTQRTKEENKKTTLSSKRKKSTGSSDSKMKTETKEETEKPYLSRERKNSKYLSPPYVSVSNWEHRRKVTKLSDDDTQPEKEASGIMPQQDKEKSTTETDKVKAPAADVLSSIRATAVCPQSVNKNNSVDKVEGFLSIFRSSMFSDGSNYNSYNQGLQLEKKTVIDHEAGASKKDDNQVDTERKSQQKRKKNVLEVGKSKESGSDQSKLKTTEESKPKKSRKVKSNEDLMSNESKKLKTDKPKSDGSKHKKTMSKESASATSVKINDTKIEGTAVLCAKFVAGCSLPTKNDLVEIYSKFGEINEQETNIFHNNLCARIVFLKTADAETALNSSQTASPFGAASLNFCLENPSAASENHNPESLSPADDLAYIKEKLESMAEILENSREKDPRLVNEMKGVIDKVSAMLN